MHERVRCGSKSPALWRHAQCPCRGYLFNDLGRPSGTRGVPTEILLEETSKHRHKQPGPKYYLAILCPGQSLTNTTDTQCRCGYKMRLILHNILGQRITGWHKEVERSVGQEPRHLGSNPSASPYLTPQGGSPLYFCWSTRLSLKRINCKILPTF